MITAVEIEAKAKELKQKGYPVISLAIGEPDFPVHESIKDTIYKAVLDNKTYYPNPQGILELREAVAEYETKRKGIHISPDEILITAGGKPVIFYSIFSLCNKDDEVILLEPYYLVYPYWCKVLNIKYKVIKLEENGTIPKDEFLKALNSKTRLIIINYPNNPQGSLMNKENLDLLLEALEKFSRLYILSDEVYSELVYEGEHISIFKYNKERVILLESFSKTYSMTGLRLGYGIFPIDMIKNLKTMNSNLITGPSTPIQYAGIVALKDENVKNYVKTMLEEFRKRRDFLYEELKTFVKFKPQGAFYYFIKIPYDGLEFCNRALNEKYLAITPGILFGDSFKNYVRISFANSMENLKEGIRRFKELL
ncbi:MAG: aminotransferase class I/II-fold pyridoxal phosphate-dependent enzyme [candidate division WOR-3 bacterium]|nr:aminotransferase class I/II-fold pyridoxal phosphate-dependent enzyme [candidate division WOR-3 bacterium]MCX7947640.1 aminotransferase class I/II-fold pyridoxal phosphate-dependent enzyme [candidate division WOR-3 bacterium]MDW8150518.1 aminotransferase class I/II-fold pyridoxal phosphate-dependent enzyme [candidate division WOR-3 bacterium]